MRDDTNNLNNHVPHRADESGFAHDRLLYTGRRRWGKEAGLGKRDGHTKGSTHVIGALVDKLFLTVALLKTTSMGMSLMPG